jgi:thiamine-monophosphate kinase
LTHSDDSKTLRAVGERHVVRRILETLHPSPMLLDGLGHDAAFVDLPLADGELLVVNSDRSGLNIAYQLGLAGADCVGDLGVSHAISDVVAAGGAPKAVTIALLLPPDTTVAFVLDVMRGAERAAARYGAIVAGGDTKQNPKFAMVVTAIGAVLRERRLVRSAARVGDALVVTGHLGSMLLGTTVAQRRLDCPTNVRAILETALVHQHPPFRLGRALADARIANACIDISDGLSGALFSLCSASGVGAIIDESRIPTHPELAELSRSLELRPMQLALAGGDWQYLYSIPPERLPDAQHIARSVDAQLTVIGRVVEAGVIAARTTEGDYRPLRQIEHDSFGDGLKGTGYFTSLGAPLLCFGDELPAEMSQHLSALTLFD